MANNINYLGKDRLKEIFELIKNLLTDNYVKKDEAHGIIPVDPADTSKLNIWIETR